MKFTLTNKTKLFINLLTEEFRLSDSETVVFGLYMLFLF